MDSGSGGSYGIPQKRLHGMATLSPTSFCPQMDTLPCLDLGTRPFVCGICQLETPPEDSKATPRTS